MRRPTGILHDGGPAGREVTLRPIAEPSGLRRHIRVLGNAELRFRTLNEVSILIRSFRNFHCWDRTPSVLSQDVMRPIHSDLERLPGSRRQVDELHELLIL